jgi:hypothetical protein
MMKYVKEQMEAGSDFAKSLSPLKEDYDYSFVEYQGANLTHWSFDPTDEDTKRIKASFMCAHAFLIADGDVKTKGKREETYEAMLGNSFLVLPTKEIENLLPPEVLKKLVLDTFHENKKSTEEIRYEAYSQPQVGLGAYLDSLLDVRPSTSIFADRSGTIKSSKKASFCEKAVAIMSDPEFDWKLTQKGISCSLIEGATNHGCIFDSVQEPIVKSCSNREIEL